MKDTSELSDLRICFTALQSVIVERSASEAIDCEWPMSPRNEKRFERLVELARELGHECREVRREEARYLERDA